jgi:hypothetical protein
MSLSTRIAAEKQKATTPKPDAGTTATAKSGKAEGEDDDEKMAEDEDDPKPEEKKTKKAKSKAAKKAESEEDEETAEGDDDDEKMAAVAANPGLVAELCADANVPKMAKALIDAKLPLGQVKSKIAAAADIRAAFEAGKRICRTIDPARAESYINAGASAKHVKAELFDQIVKAQGPEIRNSHSAAPAGAGAGGGSFGWDGVVAKINGTAKA